MNINKFMTSSKKIFSIPLSQIQVNSKDDEQYQEIKEMILNPYQIISGDFPKTEKDFKSINNTEQTLILVDTTDIKTDDLIPFIVMFLLRAEDETNLFDPSILQNSRKIEILDDVYLDATEYNFYETLVSVLYIDKAYGEKDIKEFENKLYDLFDKSFVDDVILKFTNSEWEEIYADSNERQGDLFSQYDTDEEIEQAQEKELNEIGKGQEIYIEIQLDHIRDNLTEQKKKIDLDKFNNILVDKLEPFDVQIITSISDVIKSVNPKIEEMAQYLVW